MYEIGEGDTLSEVANGFGIPLSQLVTFNQIENADQVIPGQKIRIPISNPRYRQEHRLSCEAASLEAILYELGHAVSEDQLIQDIGFDETGLRVSEGEMTWADPNEGFVGDIDGRQLFSGALEKWPEYPAERWGYGVYIDPLLKVARRHGLSARRVQDLADLYRSLDQGWRIIAYIPSYGQTETNVWKWHTPSGREIKAMDGEHAVVVARYDQEGVYVTDPLGMIERYTRSDFERAWSHLKMAGAFKGKGAEAASGE